MSVVDTVSGDHPSTVTETCDVCIVGAGLAGMNALFVAAQYLRRDQRIVLIDRRQRLGGMWVDTYPYVRLHQPHPMFTAGDVRWTLDRERGYLASQPEILDHFEHCLTVIREQAIVDDLLGWEMESDVETDGAVRVTCRGADGRRRVITTPRLIKAYGFGVTPNAPLEIRSDAVRSVSPDFCDVRTGDIAASDAPVWVIGGGKTGMDTCHALITSHPGREVNLVAGAGTFFLNRDKAFPAWCAAMVVRDHGERLGCADVEAVRRDQRTGSRGDGSATPTAPRRPPTRRTTSWASCPRMKAARSQRV